MKLLRNMALVANGLLLAAMLGACQTENDTSLPPQSSATAPDRNAKTVFVPQLIKDGDRVLQYSTNALGRKVLDRIVNQTGNTYLAFTYTPQLVTVKNYEIGTDKYLGEFSYKLDANGRCYESISMNKGYGFEYNPDGQLIKQYSKSVANERTEFVYSVFPGSNAKALYKILFYDKFDKKYREVTYNYGAKPDLSLLNPDSFFDISALYLNIFGKFNTNLPSLMMDETGAAYNKTSQNWILEYTFNADGYAKTVSKKIQGSNSVSITERKYSSPIAQ